jgi:hypothetical protein
VVSITICCLMTIAVFAQTKYPMLFLVPPVMLLAAWRQEVLGAVRKRRCWWRPSRRS